ncbi:MAG: type III pantothenate kinase [Bacteroidota bacterium]|nr:type III pantothenate kinase [Bacteroidota bacterium]
MNKTLCLDFGNSRLKAAIFLNEEIKETFLLREDAEIHLQEVLQHHQPHYSILSSVIEHSAAIEELLNNQTKFHKLTNTSSLAFTIPVGKPETVGADRLAIASAAVNIFPGQHNLVIALGSCITYNFINKQHQLLGGAITPGMEMRFRAMHEFTAKLPMAKATWNVPLIGYDTITNLQSGVVLGIAGEIDKMIDLYNNRYSNFNVLLTGGDIPFFEPHLKKKIFADPHLIFKGLYAISKINHV